MNEVRGRHVDDPERRAARRLTRRLEALGVRVGGRAGAGTPPSGLVRVAGIRGPTVATVLRPVNTGSWNFGAEVLGKRLGQERAGAPGTIAKGATATEAWASAAGVGVDANDASGLSYRNRVTAAGVARLLGVAEDTPWGPALRTTLASPGSGTLRERLGGVRVRAKTGTLRGVSALSGWVWLERRGAWGEFSIISSGLSKARAVAIEDAAVRLLAARGR
ncbi:MAG TPA: D-alanyl-D-alanine carboxypeptidase [Actinomycetota bacterium]|nr:D-alanyl-D-alanine carboxypeptidase [Actinomycetota bacterium]